MNSVDQATNLGMDALRSAIIQILTGATDEEALLKEHYDNLCGLTHISKKTLKRFFKDKAHVGPQTRNLLAAVALGKSYELDGPASGSNTYYLEFLNSLNPVSSESMNEAPPRSVWQFGKALAQHYHKLYASLEFSPLNCIRVNTEKGLRYSNKPKTEVDLNIKILTRHPQVLITAEAGMGKSTFARYLCQSWAKLDNPDTDIPVYIDLKNLDFERQTLGISSFLMSQYFESRFDWMVLDFLERNTDRYYFILDGFDDLTSKEKNTLMNDLHAFSPSVQFIILSRPYGFQDFAYPSRALYHISGFKLESQESFVKNFLSEIQSDLDPISFMTYIHSHKVLTTLARSPMHLYRLVSLAAKTKTFKRLQDIKSGIELQQLFNRYVD